jgi:hypothetical protein
MISENESVFSVGQVVYFIASKTESIIPALIAEKIVRTRMDGERVGYILSVRTKQGLERAEIDPSKTKLFSTTADVRVHMLELATGAIDRLINAAETAAEGFAQTRPPPATLNEMGEEEAQVILEDGKIARIRMT